MISRRQFLRVGLFSALALSTAGAWRAATAGGARTSQEQDPRRRILAAIVPVMLAEALPAEPDAHAEALAATIAGVESAIAGLPPMAQKELEELFALLDFAPARWLLTGIDTDWHVASNDKVAHFLARWRHSLWSLPQSGYQALHQLIFAAWYSQARAWASIGYSGPPPLS